MPRTFRWALFVALVCTLPATAAVAGGEGGHSTKARSAEVIQLYRQGKLAEALSKAEEALAVAERAHGPDHVAVGMALYNLAVLYGGLHRFQENEAALLRARAIFERHPDAPAPDILPSSAPEGTALAHTLVYLAQVQAARGDAPAGKETLYSLLELHHGRDADHPGLDFVFGWLVQLEGDAGEFGKALDLCDRLVRFREQLHGQGSRPVAEALNLCGTSQHRAGHWSRAVATFERALRIAEATLQPRDETLAAIVGNLAALHHLLGRPREAEVHYERALALQEQVHGVDAPALAPLVTNLSVFHLGRADFERAETLARRAVELADRGPDPMQQVLARIHLSSVLFKLNELEEVTVHLERARGLAEQLRGTRPQAYGQVLLRLAELFRQQRDYSKAVAYAAEGVAVFEQALGAHHPYVADALDLVGILHFSRFQLDESRAALERALGIRYRVLGRSHPEVVTNLTNLAMVEKRAGKLRAALKIHRQATELRERILRELLALGTEEQKLRYLGDLAWETRQVLRAHLPAAVGDQEAARLALLTVLRRKGRVLDVMRDDLAWLRRKLRGRDAALLERLTDVRRQLSAAVLAGPAREPAVDVAALRREGERLEREIGSRSQAFRATAEPVSIEAVQRALPDDGALLEYVAYRPAVEDLPEGHRRYAAYVLPREGDVRAVDLGPAAPIDQLVRKLRRVLADPRSLPEAVERELAERIMQPVRPLLGDKTRVFLSPEGALQLVPFAALRGEDGEPLLRRYSFVYLTSGRDLLRPALTPTQAQEMVLVGAPAFGSPEGQSDESESSRGKAQRLRFSPLPGTADELEALAQLVSSAKRLTGPEASEPSVKSLHGPRVLHIATHGFFLPSEDSKRDAAASQLLRSADAEEVSLSAGPLLRSGLALAGANDGPHGADDGIMTALEASMLDLSGTQLVVLSACETGVGEIRAGQGVHGLRRAFVMAGAETQMMSLWRIDDAATRELMVAYYRKLLEGGDRIEALRQVQLEMLGEQRRRHPFYWASFIVSGRGGPIFPKRPESKVPEVEPGPRGCACHLGGRRSSSPLGWLALVVLAFWRRSRRARYG